jgi:hypothetical protein
MQEPQTLQAVAIRSLLNPLDRQLLMDLSFPRPLRPHHLGIDLCVCYVHDDLWAREQAVDLLERQVARFGI